MKILFLLLILIPIFEISTFIISLKFVGLSYSIYEIIITFFLGYYLFYVSKKNLYYPENKRFIFFGFNKMMLENKASSLFMLIGSSLLIIPGYIGDIIGILLFLKPIQNIMVKYIFSFLETPFEKNKFYTNSNTEIIEGEFYDLHNDKRNISKK